MSFDPFGDFATEGYLRNVEKEKDLDIVKRLEHTSFTTGLDEAFTALGKSRQFSYSDVLRTHGTLFNAVKIASRLLRRSPSARDPSFLPTPPKSNLRSSSR